MTKREVYKRVFGNEVIYIEGIDWDSEVDDAFEMELEVIKQMVERMQNESNSSTILEEWRKENGTHN